MKRVLEGILAVLIAILSCIVFLNVILRYGFQTSILSVDELSRYLFVWLTFIGAIVAFMDNAHVQVTFLVEKLWSDHSPILGIPIGLMYAACLPTGVAIALIELRRLYILIASRHSSQQPQQGA